jgi:spermidine/putrescine ABC transporter ATP-binding subunit
MVSSLNSRAGAEVRLQNLTKSFGSALAVDDVSVTIGRGEFFTILGPSGSGKTTTMMMVAGFVYPTSGSIQIGEKNVADLPPQKRDLGMVFQNYAVFPHLSVFENVAFPLRVRKTPKDVLKASVEEALDLVKLREFAERMPKQLSGGQQQRVALARALVFKPSVLLMDEPLGALDKKLRDHMQTEIRRIHQRLGVTVIYVTHDQGEALTMSDRIAIMNDGKIEQIGSPADLYDRPNTRFVADFLGDTNFISGKLVEVSGDQGTVQISDGWSFSGALSDPSLRPGASVVAGVRPEKIHVADANEKPTNTCAATVFEVVYSGDVTRYEVRGPGDVSLIVSAPNRSNVARHQEGQTITLAWDRAETRIFPA